MRFRNSRLLDLHRLRRRCVPLYGLLVATASLLWLQSDHAAAQRAQRELGAVEYETTSKYSRIRIRKTGDVRSLIFVRDSGLEVIETQMDLKKPGTLRIPYTRTMFASYLFRPKQKRVLIVGLGGGAMVRFLQKHDSELKIEAVEIDPEIVRIAKKYFGVSSGKNTTIITDDAFRFLDKTDNRYDVIYMDAFLKPTAKTDATGVPLRLKTLKFYKSLHEKLTDDGLVVFNLNKHRRIGRDIAVIRRGFPQFYLFRVPGTAGLVAVASMNRKRASSLQLKTNAVTLDKRLRTNFTFQGLLKTRYR